MYTGKEKTPITKTAAATNITASSQSRIADFNYTYFSKKALEDLLSVPNAVGVRLYHGTVPIQGQTYKTLIVVAVDAVGNDLHTTGEVLLGELPCPIFCDDGKGENLLSGGLV